MIENLVERVRAKGPEERLVTDYCVSRMATYFNSQCYKLFKNNYNVLRDMIDMKTAARNSTTKKGNQWLSNISMPMVREAYLARRAAAKSACRMDPLITVEPSLGTPVENARNMQDVLTSNFYASRFKENALWPAINWASRCGSAVMSHTFHVDLLKKKKTVFNGMMYGQTEVQSLRRMVKSSVEHSLNYFQNPSVPEPYESDYQGFLRRLRLSEQIADYEQNGDAYVKENMLEFVKAAVKGTVGSQFLRAANKDAKGDIQQVASDIAYWYGTLNVKDNEEDSREYCLLISGDSKILKIEENPYDENIRPISIFGFDKRLDNWWSNTDVQNQVPFENMANIFLRMTADEGLKALQRIIFLDKRSGLDVATFNEQRVNGGVVEFQGKDNLSASGIFHEFQGRDTSLGATQAILGEMKEAGQRVRSKVDMSRKENQGGLKNSTATAATILNDEGNEQEFDYLENFFAGVSDTGYKHTCLLQQFLGEEINVRENPRSPMKTIEKKDILGEFDYRYSTSLTKNKQFQITNLMNVLTFLQNMKGTGDPSWMNVQLPTVIRSYLQKILPEDINADEAYPPQVQQQMQLPAPQMGPNGVPEAAMSAPMASQPQQAGVPQ